MIDFLLSIVATIANLISFLINAINALISLIINIPNYLLLVINSINLLPSFLIPFMMAFVSLVVVQYILNRKA